MRWFTVFLVVLLFSPSVYSQEESTVNKEEQKQLAKEKRNAEKAQAEEKQKELTTLMLDYQRFVLEADYISGSSGQRSPVNSTLNFIIIDSTEATLQLGSPWGLGINGVGGITVDGNVTRYKVDVKETKRGESYTITLFIMTSLGTYDITMWVSQSGKADATIRGNVSGQLTYSGQLVPLGKSRVYKGSAIP
jgi:hypothetical protein